ncbi:MAG: serine hydrolase [Bryobacteraceae bacterium]|nr:serine hydrolase [Bryobacteraceae bacterium]
MKRRVSSSIAAFAFLALNAFSQTGAVVPDLAVFDRAIPALMSKYQLPGTAVSIAKDGRLVYARGFGIGDVTTAEPVQPDSLFRIASLSKPLTAIGVLKLMEDGKLTLDTRVLPFIGRKASSDVRWDDITVRHLLQHSGGLDIELWGFDPSFPDLETLEALGANLPPTRSDVLDFILARLPLAFAPGTRYAYSNVGYMLLTEVVEKASGQPYETYMREKIFAPLGIRRMRIAGSLLTERQPGEVRYWDKDSSGAPIFPGLPEMVPVPYGFFNLRIFESGGGWLASAPDLVRFLTAFDGGTVSSILRPATVNLISERPSYAPATATSWYGLGWGIQRSANGVRWDHDGAFEGTAAWMFRGVNGISLAIATNHLPDVRSLAALFDEFQTLLNDNALAITRWPPTNTFETYFPAQAPRISNAGVVNAASLRPGPVAAGSPVTIFGVNLTGGTVRVNGTAADILWAAPDQLTVAVPLSANGVTRFEVDVNGRTSNVESVVVRGEAPAVFTISRSGYGQAAALNQDGSVNSRQRPAAKGSVAMLFVTGVTRPVVTIGGVEAQVVFSGQAPGLPRGVVQINARLPQSLPAGELPLLIKSSEVSSQGGVTLYIE